jgi:hypothetical protein
VREMIAPFAPAGKPGRRGWVYVFIPSFASVCVAMSLLVYYLSTQGTEPRPDAGKVYPLYNHGYIVYLTHQQHLLCDLLLWLGLLGVFVSFLLKRYASHNP